MQDIFQTVNKGSIQYYCKGDIQRSIILKKYGVLNKKEIFFINTTMGSIQYECQLGPKQGLSYISIELDATVSDSENVSNIFKLILSSKNCSKSSLSYFRQAEKTFMQV